MVSFIARRGVLALFELFFVSVVIFIGIRLIPGDPVQVLLGRAATAETLEAARRKYGLDQPIYKQYLVWTNRMLHGDFGMSIRFEEPVLPIVLERYPRTLSLVFLGLFVALIIAFAAGLSAATNYNTWFDLFISSGSLLGISLPNFWIGILMALLFGVKLHWFPTTGYVPLSEGFIEYLRHLLIPGFSLGIITGATLTRMVRGSMLDVLNQQYVITARSKGLSERVVYLKHALRNAFSPILTVIGIQVGFMLGGTVIIEQIFTYPGMGQLIIDAIFHRDYPIVIIAVLCYGATFIIINLLVDILYGVVDPRVRTRD